MEKNVTLDPRLSTFALDMEPSTLDKKIDSQKNAFLKRARKRVYATLRFPRVYF